MLAVVAVASRAHRPAEERAGRPHTPKLVGLRGDVMFVLFPLGAFLIFWVASSRRRRQKLIADTGPVAPNRS